MYYEISLFAPEDTGISSIGIWRLSAETQEQAIDMVKSYASPSLWPTGSTWLVIPLEEEAGESECGRWEAA